METKLDKIVKSLTTEISEVKGMTKKAFTELACIHTYTGYNGKKTSTHILYFDYKRDTEKGVNGYKYALGGKGLTKKELINRAYDYIVKETYCFFPYEKIANTDNERFKVSISMRF